MTTSTKLRGLSVVLLLALASALWTGRTFVRALAPEDYARFESIEIGMSRENVLHRLGPPDYDFEAGTAPENYCMEGYSCKRRPIDHRVYIYIGGEPIAYIYFDSGDRVQEVYIGGS